MNAYETIERSKEAATSVPEAPRAARVADDFSVTLDAATEALARALAEAIALDGEFVVSRNGQWLALDAELRATFDGRDDAQPDGVALEACTA